MKAIRRKSWVIPFCVFGIASLGSAAFGQELLAGLVESKVIGGSSSGSGENMGGDASQIELSTGPSEMAPLPSLDRAASDTDGPASSVDTPDENVAPTSTQKLPPETTTSTEATITAPVSSNGPPSITPADATPIFGAGAITAFSENKTSLTSKWKVSPHFSVSTVYDDNIFLTKNNKTSDFVFTLSPGLTVQIGAPGSQLHLTADYTAGFVFFAGGKAQNSVDQNAFVDVSWQFTKLKVGLHLGYLSTTGGSLDVGDRVRRNVFYAGFTSEYLLDDKFSVELNADESYADYGRLLDSNEVRAQLFLNYQVSPKIKLGIGGTYGFVTADESSDQTYEQVLVHGTYTATEKLALNASVGCEFRQFDSGEGDAVSPVFSLGATYTPFERTTITLDAHRRIYTSAALVGQDYAATGFAATVRQRIGSNKYLSLAGGYENSTYQASNQGVPADRVDNYYFLRPAFDWMVKSWLTVGLFYEYSMNASSGFGSNSFSRNRVGAVMTVVF